jgi:serine/threonine protein kinase
MQSHNAIYWLLRELVAECSIQSIWTQEIYYLTIKELSKDVSFIHSTSGYIAPEILEVGDPERVKRTFASDMWSLGVVIYFAMSRGEHPFSYRNPTEPNNCREEMIRRTKMLRNVSKISEY